MRYPIYLPLDSGPEEAFATLDHPSSSLWELEMHNGLDNRLTGQFLRECLMIGLDIVEKDWRNTPGSPGALVICGRKDQQRFFSNGLDYEPEKAVRDPGCTNRMSTNSQGQLQVSLAECLDCTDAFGPFLARLLGFPIPTIAAINGHAFAAGFILALACDYRVMTSGRAWCSMNEIFLGSSLGQSFAAVLNYKLPKHKVLRKTAIEGHRWTPQELRDVGVIDQLADGGTQAVLEAARGLAETKSPLATSGVFGLIKKDLERDIFDEIKDDNRRITPADMAGLVKLRL